MHTVLRVLPTVVRWSRPVRAHRPIPQYLHIRPAPANAANLSTQVERRYPGPTLADPANAQEH